MDDQYLNNQPDCQDWQRSNASSKPLDLSPCPTSPTSDDSIPWDLLLNDLNEQFPNPEVEMPSILSSSQEYQIAEADRNIAIDETYMPPDILLDELLQEDSNQISDPVVTLAESSAMDTAMLDPPAALDSVLESSEPCVMDTTTQDSSSTSILDWQMLSDFTQELTSPAVQSVGCDLEDSSLQGFGTIKPIEVTPFVSTTVADNHDRQSADASGNEKKRTTAATMIVPKLANTDPRDTSIKPSNKFPKHAAKTRKNQVGKLSARPKASRATKLHELLGDCYRVQTLNYAPESRAARDIQNSQAVKERGGPCMRCIFYRRKCSVGYPCQQCRSVSRNHEIDCIRADVKEFNVWAIGQRDLSDFLGPEKRLRKPRTVDLDVSLFINMFAFYETQPDPSRIQRLQEIRFLCYEYNFYGPHVWWQAGSNPCLNSSATILFNISSSILANSNCLLSLDPEEYPWIEACRARSGTCVLNLVDRLLRGQYPSSYPSFYDLGMRRFILVSIITLLDDLNRLISDESVSVESQEACQFMKRYLSESTKLIERGCPEWWHRFEATPLYEDDPMFKDEKTEDRFQKVLVLFDLHQFTIKLQRLAMIIPYAWQQAECHHLPMILTLEDFSYALMTVSQLSGRPSDLLEMLSRSVGVCAGIRWFLLNLAERFVRMIAEMRKVRVRNDFLLKELTCRKIDSTTGVPGSIWSVAQSIAQNNIAKIDGLETSRGQEHSPDSQHTWATFVTSAFRCLLPVVFRLFNVLSTDQTILALYVLREGAAFEVGASFFLDDPDGRRFLDTAEGPEPMEIENLEVMEKVLAKVLAKVLEELLYSNPF